MPRNFKITMDGETRRVSDLILKLDPANPRQHAWIGELWTLCHGHERYTGETGDKVSGAIDSLWKGMRPVADYESGWVARWANSPAHISDARRWATSENIATA